MLVRILTFSFIIVTASFFSALAGSDVPPPKLEHRSVWIATAHSLDFPKMMAKKNGYDHSDRLNVQDWPSPDAETAEEKKQDLIDIIETSHEIGLNAVIFQVVPRGDAFYQSERLPWSHHLTGTAGQDPGWDPLEVAIEEAHKRGMELHAWYNVGRIGDPSQPLPGQEPFHVYQDHEEWVQVVTRDDGVEEFWLDQGIPDARDWMVDNVMEIVENYDMDAIHFDFIRYPSGGFDSDSETMEQYNVNDIDDINDWRRDNINEFLRDVYPSIKEYKPWVKVGSTPVGHYTNVPEFTWGAFYGYDNAFQDSRGWLEEEINDYIAPQIYWDIGDDYAPKFDVILNDWANDMRGRHVYIGKGPYQVSIDKDEITAQIDSTRKAEVHGSVFFRYDNVSPDVFGEVIVEDRYSLNAAIVPPMEWMDTNIPEVPQFKEPVARILENDAHVNLSWNDQDFETADGDTLIRYAVYRVNALSEPDPEVVKEDGSNLLAITGKTEFSDNPPAVSRGNYYYYVSALNRNNNESSLSDPYEADAPVSSEEESEIVKTHRLNQNYPNPFNPKTEISYELALEAHVELTVYDITGRKVTTLHEGRESAGEHSVSFDASRLSSGVYLYRLNVREGSGGASVHTETRRMTLVK